MDRKSWFLYWKFRLKCAFNPGTMIQHFTEDGKRYIMVTTMGRQGLKAVGFYEVVQRVNSRLETVKQSFDGVETTYQS
jgi:hypothetical protein|nr:MAG TPA_asm: hypothetical protein [Caudoviricetes sp.]